ncbi:hypothetical protein PITC_075390 [Penicillium italicum]|uniref:Uncharacterized protein n=1 Tax=Penicillium italicum TaxID=40296 RepID=A0A0A2KYR7_PENIT|nr:hypothetical protein PITC_075390 [Penicillium italicum]
MFYFSLLNSLSKSLPRSIYGSKKWTCAGLNHESPRKEHENSQRGCLHKLGAVTIGPQVLCRKSVGDSPHYKIYYGPQSQPQSLCLGDLVCIIQMPGLSSHHSDNEGCEGHQTLYYLYYFRSQK